MLILIVGSAGRMGQTLVEAACSDEKIDLTGYVRCQSQGIGRGKGSLTEIAKNVDVLIDFSTPELTLESLGACKNAIVIGTTGLNDEELEQILSNQNFVQFVFAANMSRRVKRFRALAARAIGNYVDIEILEAHHRHKSDAPSTTALMMWRSIGSRHFTFTSLRAVERVGEHTIMCYRPFDRLTITHTASNRINFATGAVLAAKLLEKKPAGCYEV